MRGSEQRGRMYRHSPWCDHRFRSSKPRLTPRSPVGFFGSGGSLGSPRGTDHPAYFGLADYYVCLSFSAVDMCDPTAVLKIVNAQGWCNYSLFLCANLFAQATAITSVFKCRGHYSRPIHIFFTGRL